MDVKAAERQMEVASERLKKADKGYNPGLETAYAAAYQALVRIGARPQIRAKYRRVR